MPKPAIFISYSHADKPLARSLADELERRGVKVWIDERELRVGDSIIERVATAVAEADYFLALVSEASRESRWCQKELHLAVTGELGREGVRVLPLRVGGVAMPDTLKDVFYLDVNPIDVAPTVERLAGDVKRHVEDRESSSEKPSARRSASKEKRAGPATPRSAEKKAEVANSDTFDPIRILGIVREGVGEPTNDGTRGSALYRVPLRLSRRPSDLWTQIFEHEWNNQLYSMLRRAHSQGNTIVFPGTTMDEMEQHHVQQLQRVMERVNAETGRIEREARVRAQREAEERAAIRRAHGETIDRIAERLKFD